MNDSTETTIGRDGVERWDCGTPVSQNNAFRVAPDGMRIDVAKMAQSHRNSVGSSRALSRDQAAGKSRGTMRGMSRTADERIAEYRPDPFALASPKLAAITERQTQAYGKALGNPVPNFVSMKRKGAPTR